MKKFFIMLFAACALLACNKAETTTDNEQQSEQATATVKTDTLTDINGKTIVAQVPEGHNSEIDKACPKPTGDAKADADAAVKFALESFEKANSKEKLQQAMDNFIYVMTKYFGEYESTHPKYKEEFEDYGNKIGVKIDNAFNKKMAELTKAQPS